MPYTPAHAIATTPIWYLFGKRLPLAALVVGSMSPDFPYLAALTPIYAPGHTFAGLLPYCLLPSMIVLAIWYRWLEKPILFLFQLPPNPRRESPLGFALYVMVGALIGAVTHVVWDSSSHGNGWLVQRYGWLRTDVLGQPFYKWNQHLGGVFGLAGLVAWYWYSRAKARCKRPTFQQYRVAAVSLSVPMILLVCAANLIHETETFGEFAVRSAVGVLTGFAVGVVVYASWANAAARKNQAERGASRAADT